MPTLGEQLKSLRIKKGMTQEQLAQKLNTTKAAISRYERDQRQPRLEQITEMAMILDASADDLYSLFLGSSEIRGGNSEETYTNAMEKWIKTICGDNAIGDSTLLKQDPPSLSSLKPVSVTYDPGDSFTEASFTVHKEVPSENVPLKLTISVEPEGMKLKDLISLLDFLKNNNLAGDGIPEMIDFMKAAYKSGKNDQE